MIDWVIDHHINWFQAFSSAVESGQTANLSEATRLDHTVGGWLASPESMALLGSDLHARAVAIHSTIRDIAQEIVDSLEEGSRAAMQGLLKALGELSEGLVHFLDFAGKHLDGELTHWTLAPLVTE